VKRALFDGLVSASGVGATDRRSSLPSSLSLTQSVQSVLATTANKCRYAATTTPSKGIKGTRGSCVDIYQCFLDLVVYF